MKLQYESQFTDFIKNNKTEFCDELKTKAKFYQDQNIPFQNIYYPLDPYVLFIDSEMRAQVQDRAEKMSKLLEKVILLYKTDKATQTFFMLNEIQRSLVSIDPGYRPYIRISRYDSLIEHYSQQQFFIENNTDCPAGILFTSRLMQLINSIASFKNFTSNHLPIATDPIGESEGFANELLNTYKNFSGKKVTNPRIAILQLRKAASPEVHEMIKIFCTLGFDAVIADPRDLVYKNHELCFQNETINLIWSKINTVHFDALFNDKRSLLPLLQACKNRTVCHINSFAARYITESKVCAAYLKNETFRHHFDDKEKKIIDSCIPWSCKLENRETLYEGRKINILNHALQDKDCFVLKGFYDIRGENVLIGKQTSRVLWKDQIKKCLGKQFIIQKFIEPSKIRIFDQKENKYIDKKFSLDLFMFAGKFQGFGSKSSLSDKLNLFQGGSKIPVFSVKAPYNT